MQFPPSLSIAGITLMNYLDSYCPGVSPGVPQVVTRKALEVYLRNQTCGEGREVLGAA